MKERDVQICKAILTALNRVDGQLAEPIIHADVREQFKERGAAQPSVEEFALNLIFCNDRRWIVGVAGKISGRMKWSLRDEGKAALLEM